MQYRVLFADRSPIIRTLVEDILQRDGFEVKTAADGVTALHDMDSFKPHIILADISLSGLDGYCLCKEAKEKTANPNIPVILLAGAYDPYDEEYANLVSADDYILKPFESLELIGKIRKLLNYEYSSAYEPPSYSEDTFSGQIEPTTVTEESAGEAQSSDSDKAVENTEKDYIELVDVEKTKEEGISPHHQAVEYELSGKVELSQQTAHDELRDIVISSLDELIAHQFKTDLSGELSSSIREQIQKVVYEIAPAVVEDILREKTKIVLSSLMEEIQAEIKNALPDIVETIIRRKFEKVN